jgi:asparagine N-glycosylation enzyme membrane subunit Stt3
MTLLLVIGYRIARKQRAEDMLFFAYPSAVATVIGENPISRWGGGEPSGSRFSEWLETMTWMRYNTPDPGIDYLAIYEKPKNSTYPYPDTAYGVMSWWDYGHVKVFEPEYRPFW